MARVPSLPASSWCVYVLQCADGSLYCGITNDLEKRLEQHRLGKGARYTRGRAPLELMRSWTMDSRPMALKVERRFKKLRRAVKIKRLADPEWHGARLLPEPASAVAKE